MTLSSADTPAWLVQSPAGSNFIDLSFSQDDGKRGRQEGTLASFLTVHIVHCLRWAG